MDNIGRVLIGVTREKPFRQLEYLEILTYQLNKLPERPQIVLCAQSNRDGSGDIFLVLNVMKWI